MCSMCPSKCNSSSKKITDIHPRQRQRTNGRATPCPRHIQRSHHQALRMATCNQRNPHGDHSLRQRSVFAIFLSCSCKCYKNTNNNLSSFSSLGHSLLSSGTTKSEQMKGRNSSSLSRCGFVWINAGTPTTSAKTLKHGWNVSEGHARGRVRL